MARKTGFKMTNLIKRDVVMLINFHSKCINYVIFIFEGRNANVSDLEIIKSFYPAINNYVMGIISFSLKINFDMSKIYKHFHYGNMYKFINFNVNITRTNIEEEMKSILSEINTKGTVTINKKILSIFEEDVENTGKNINEGSIETFR